MLSEEGFTCGLSPANSERVRRAAGSRGAVYIRAALPLPDIQLIATGGVNASNARVFLDAGAVAVGIGSALTKATPADRRALVQLVLAK